MTSLFSAVLLAPTENCSHFRLEQKISMLSNSNHKYSLFLSSVILYLLLTPFQQVCTDISDCWITIPAPGDLITDMAANSIVPIPGNLSLTLRTPLSFVPDNTSPNLTSFNLDLSNRVLVLEFDEPVRVSSLNASGLTLLSSPSQSDPDYIHTFQSLNSVSLDGTIIDCIISDDDVSAILVRTGLAISRVNLLLIQFKY